MNPQEDDMEHKHTPGPWEPECRSGDWVVISARDKNAVAWPNRPRGNEVEANVRLIAAAPDLLEALQSIADCCNEDHTARDYASRQAEIRGIARAAIAKATGATP